MKKKLPNPPKIQYDYDEYQKEIKKRMKTVSRRFVAQDDNITKEMTDLFEKRTEKHIKYVQEAIDKIVETYPEFAELKERGKIHDQSKYEEPEHKPYIWITWMYKHKNNNKPFKYPEGVEEETNKATEHHTKNNKHHPEYWNNQYE